MVSPARDTLDRGNEHGPMVTRQHTAERFSKATSFSTALHLHFVKRVSTLQVNMH